MAWKGPDWEGWNNNLSNQGTMKTTMTHKNFQAAFRLGLLFTLAGSAGLLAQGPLAPPTWGSFPFADQALDSTGVPRSNMKSLTQTDPGQPIPSRDADLPDLNGSGVAYTIKAPGHYYLSENLVGDKPIVIDADNVTLDLRGFEMRYVPGSASGPATAAISSTHARVTVRNGKIVGGWSDGVVLGGEAHVDSIAVAGIESFGVKVGENSFVQKCQVQGPPLGEQPMPRPHAGIFAEGCSVVSHSSVKMIHGKGIEVTDGSRIVDCTACGCVGCGIVGMNNNAVFGCTALQCGVTGIDFGMGNSIVNCTASKCGDDGFLTRAGCTLTHCISQENQGDGFAAEPMDPEGPEPWTAVSFLHCSATWNNHNGFLTTINSSFTHCTADMNGTHGTPSHGFEIGDGNRVVRCTATNNGAAGIGGGDHNYIEANQSHGNGGYGIAVSSGSNTVIRNQVKGNASGALFPAPAAGTGIAPIQPAFSATNPMANFDL